MENIKNFINKNNIKIRSLTNLIGIGLLFAAGLYFVLFIDLYVEFQGEASEIVPIAIWLFMAIIFAVGAGIFYFFGDSNKHKRTLTIVLKAIGIVFSFAYIGYIVVFKNWVNTSGNIKFDSLPLAHTTATISLIINILALVFILANFVLSIVYIDEEY